MYGARFTKRERAIRKLQTIASMPNFTSLMSASEYGGSPIQALNGKSQDWSATESSESRAANDRIGFQQSGVR